MPAAHDDHERDHSLRLHPLAWLHGVDFVFYGRADFLTICGIIIEWKGEKNIE